MKKKLLTFLIISGLGLAVSSVWLGFELWTALSVKHFNFKSIPTFAITAFVYGLFCVLYNAKPKCVRRKIIPINKYYGITEDSQNPIKL